MKIDSLLRNGAIEEALRGMGLNERQLKVISHLEEKESITNEEHQMFFDVSRITGTRDLNSLEGKDILKRIGTGKRDLKYVLK